MHAYARTRNRFTRPTRKPPHPNTALTVPPQNPEDARWFAEEVQPRERSLRAYLHTAAPATVEVDDLLQDSYLRLLRARANGQIRCAKALLFAIARNAVRDALREKRANREIPSTEIDAFAVLDDSAAVVDLDAVRAKSPAKAAGGERWLIDRAGMAATDSLLEERKLRLG